MDDLPYASLDEALAREASVEFLERAMEACAPATAAYRVAEEELHRRRWLRRCWYIIIRIAIIIGIGLTLLRGACGCMH